MKSYGMHGGLREEIIKGRFNFFSYWEECEGNKGKKMDEKEVWEELIHDLKLWKQLKK